MLHTGLSELLSGVLSGFRLELDDLEVASAGKRRVIRVTVDGDGPAGLGPDLDQIAAATRAVSQMLDDSDVLGDSPYTLEVSSRGVSRPLTRPDHFRRNIGRLLALTGVDGTRQTGRITAANEQTVTLEVSGASKVFRFDQVAKAVVQVELNRKPDADLAPDFADEESGDFDDDESDDC